MINLLRLKDKFTKEKISFGLDIGSRAIKLVKLKFFKDSVQLSNFILEPGEVDLGGVLKRIAQSEGIQRINLAVSGPSVIIRYINLPKMTEEELRQALKFEASKHIPISLDEVNIDSYILKDLADNRMLVLLAGVKKEFINQRLKLIEEAGLKTNIVDIDSLALINAFNFNYAEESDTLKDKTIVLLNIGASVSNLNILENGIPHLSRDIYIAGNNFTEKLEPEVARLVGEIRTSLDYYESQSASGLPKIFLSGGGSQINGLKDMLSNLLGIEVQYWNPLKRISISSDVDSEGIKKLSAQLAVAIGLALRP